MLLCPNCGSKDTYNHDKGWQYFTRLLTFNSRLVCRNCRTTWKRRTPEKFAKLKRRSYSKIRKKTEGYFNLPAEEKILYCNPNEINNIVAEWQDKGKLFICLDLKKVDELDTRALGNLMRIYRRLKVIGGDMILNNGSKTILDNLWSLNLGYLIASDQKKIEQESEV